MQQEKMLVNPVMLLLSLNKIRCEFNRKTDIKHAA